MSSEIYKGIGYKGMRTTLCHRSNKGFYLTSLKVIEYERHLRTAVQLNKNCLKRITIYDSISTVLLTISQNKFHSKPTIKLGNILVVDSIGVLYIAMCIGSQMLTSKIINLIVNINSITISLSATYFTVRIFFKCSIFISITIACII